MKIVVTGLRGIPGIQGGVEAHCEELLPRIVDDSHEVIVIRRPKYISAGYNTTKYQGVSIVDLKTFSNKHLEAFFHTFKAALYAKRIGADVIHIHAIGPALITPIARLLGLKVVVTHHGPDYDRQKWGRFPKFVLKIGERVGVLYANHIIVISNHIKESLNIKFPSQRSLSLVYNGVKLKCLNPSEDYIRTLNLEPHKYILAVGRFVEEKGFDLLIKAYILLNRQDIKLVIAGDADHESDYSRSLKQIAKKNNVVLTGFVQKEQLAQLYHYSKLFVLPSYHEGLPISLLEAMSCGANVLVSDIPANLEVGLPKNDYFKCGDLQALKDKISDKLTEPNDYCSYDMKKYNWDTIAQQTKMIYDSLYK